MKRNDNGKERKNIRERKRMARKKENKTKR